MKVLLRQTLDSLGEAGKVVNVKDGYARNFLLPRGLAFEANARNMKFFEQEKQRLVSIKEKEKKTSEVLKTKMDGVSITATLPVGEDDRVFGSVTNQDVADLLAAKGFEIDKRRVLLEEPVKALGIYEVQVKLHTDVEATIKLWVVKQ